MTVEKNIKAATNGIRNASLRTHVEWMFRADGTVATDNGTIPVHGISYSGFTHLQDGSRFCLIYDFHLTDWGFYRVHKAKVFRIAENVTLHVLETTDESNQRHVFLIADQWVDHGDNVIQLAAVDSQKHIEEIVSTDIDFYALC